MNLLFASTIPILVFAAGAFFGFTWHSWYEVPEPVNLTDVPQPDYQYFASKTVPLSDTFKSLRIEGYSGVETVFFDLKGRLHFVSDDGFLRRSEDFATSVDVMVSIDSLFLCPL